MCGGDANGREMLVTIMFEQLFVSIPSWTVQGNRINGSVSLNNRV